MLARLFTNIGPHVALAAENIDDRPVTGDDVFNGGAERTEKQLGMASFYAEITLFVKYGVLKWGDTRITENPVSR